MPDSGANNTAHREQDTPASNAEGESDQEEIIVEAATDNVFEHFEILAEHFTIQACKHAVFGVDQISDRIQVGIDGIQGCPEIINDLKGVADCCCPEYFWFYCIDSCHYTWDCSATAWSLS